MPKFRKKPVVIEAVQLKLAADSDLYLDVTELPNWCVNALDDGVMTYDNGFAIIKTLEGDHKALPNDWIIKGVQGELYPCKPDIFEATYERAE